MRLGIDVACRADHQASLAGVDGEFIWSGWRFRTTPSDLEALWEKIPAGAEVQVIVEPTRNAWVPLAAWLSAQGAEVVLVAPEQSADLRDYYNKHTKTDRLDSRILARLPLLHPEGLSAYRRADTGRSAAAGDAPPGQAGQGPRGDVPTARRAGRAARAGVGRGARRRRLHQDRPGRAGALRRPASLAASRVSAGSAS